jgi:hypothetical protein
MLIKLFMDGVPSDRRSADHFFGKWGLKPAGRWATPEEAAADPRLLTRPPNQAADLPAYCRAGAVDSLSFLFTLYSLLK